MTRCCSNIFLNQFTQQPPDVIVDPPAASLCYHYEDVEFAGSVFDLSAMTVDYVTINGVQTNINKDIFADWGWFGGNGFSYSAVATDMAATAVTAGVLGMGFFMETTLLTTAFAFRFSVTGENLNSISLTYTYDIGAGPVQATSNITGSNCEVEYGCYEATYTPEAPFLIDFGRVVAVTNQGITLFETSFYGPPCTEFEDVPAYLNAFIEYLQTIHGSQVSATIDIVGNTATVRILNTLLVPIHMDNQGDSGCTPPNSLLVQNNFTAIDCP